MNALKSLYYDTTLSAKSTTLKCLLDFVSSDHVTFGSDFPFLSDAVVGEEVKDFNGFFSSDENMKAQVAYKTAQTLFPRFS